MTTPRRRTSPPAPSSSLATTLRRRAARHRRRRAWRRQRQRRLCLPQGRRRHAAGAVVYWDADNCVITATAAANAYIGRAIAAASGSTVHVLLNGSNLGAMTTPTPQTAPTPTAADVTRPRSAMSPSPAPTPMMMTASPPASTPTARRRHPGDQPEQAQRRPRRRRCRVEDLRRLQVALRRPAPGFSLLTFTRAGHSARWRRSSSFFPPSPRLFTKAAKGVAMPPLNANITFNTSTTQNTAHFVGGAVLQPIPSPCRSSLPTAPTPTSAISLLRSAAPPASPRKAWTCPSSTARAAK